MNTVRFKIFVLLVTRCLCEETSNPTPTGSESPTEEVAITDTREQFLRITTPLKDLKLYSGQKVQFKCKVDGYPTSHMTYLWYKDNQVLSEDLDPRFTITSKSTVSKLRIKHLYSTDTGSYSCEATNTIQRVSSRAYLEVDFALPPDDGFKPVIPQGKCEIYKGQACKGLLQGKSIYVDPFLDQEGMESQITQAFQIITKANHVSKDCERYAQPAFCYFVFSPCQMVEQDGEKVARPIRLCREDCDIMKYDVCRDVFQQNRDNIYLQEIFTSTNCSTLPSMISSPLTSQCTEVGLGSVENSKQTCYNDSGVTYRGVTSWTQTGKACKPWPRHMVTRYRELAGARNLCRNPGDQMSGPWCYTDSRFQNKEICDISKCSSPSSGSDMILILIPSVSIPFLLGCIAFAFCFCRRHKVNKDSANRRADEITAKFTKGNVVQVPSMNKRKTKLPELNSNSINFLMEIGDGKFGKVCKGNILPNPHFSTNFPVAIKTLHENALPPLVEEYHREVAAFAELQHENLACLKAVVHYLPLRCMVFEYTENLDLHEYLVMHSPHADFPKPAASVSSHASTVIEHSDFIRMAIQVASGMEYLSSNNFIHRDLAARNVLVCGNMDLKICNLGVVRDSYLSCYYRSPQDGQMLPVRWMAPESVQNWQFTSKSPVWSFGVLVWEMFSYGSQPYCGYSNHEVIEMISRRQLLTCPDQCPARIYSLMHECWVENMQQRPQFRDLRAKLQGWMNTNNGRVTSQLAQGIHRQLNSVMREGSGHYQYSQQASSVGGSSGITYSSNLGGPTPSPPPQYNGSFPLPCSSASTFMTSQHPHPPNVSPSSQQFFSSPGTTNSFQTTENRNYQHNYQQNNQYNNGVYEPHVYNGGQYQHHAPQGYSKGPASQSSHTSSSCSSSRDQYQGQRQGYVPQNQGRDYYENQRGYNMQYSRPRPLSGVIETENDEEESLIEQRPHAVTPTPQKQKLSIIKNDSNPISPSSVGKRKNFNEVDSSDMSTSSVKATSCDSGLPVDDVEGHVIDPKTPLMVRTPSRTQGNTPLRGTTPRKFT